MQCWLVIVFNMKFFISLFPLFVTLLWGQLKLVKSNFKLHPKSVNFKGKHGFCTHQRKPHQKTWEEKQISSKKVYHRDKGSYGSSKIEKGRWLSASPKETYGEEILRAHKQMNDKKRTTEDRGNLGRRMTCDSFLQTLPIFTPLPSHKFCKNSLKTGGLGKQNES